MRSIAAKFILPVGVLVGLIMVLDIYLDHSGAQEHLAELMDRQLALGLAFDLAIRSYVAEEVRPLMKERTGPDEFIPETTSASFVARNVFEKVRQDFPDYIIKFSSDNPRNPANQASPDELRIIRYFNDHPEIDRWTGEIELGKRAHLAHFSARRMKESCLRCHGRPEDAPTALVERYGATAGFHRPVGQVIALDMVAIPIDTAQAALMAGTADRCIFVAAGLVLLFLMIALVFRFVVARRLTAMARHFERIAAQPENSPIQRIEVNGRDEISVLARSFNALADKVRDAHASLEQRVAERTVEVRESNDALRRQIRVRRRAEAHILRQSAVLEAINAVLQEALTRETEEQVAQVCLDKAQKLTDSRFGFVAEVNEDGHFDCIAVSNPGWDACQVPRPAAAKLLRDMRIRGVWGAVVKQKCSQIVNDPDSHPQRVGVPEGHPKITSFLGVPLKRGDKVVGLIAVANNQTGYEQHHAAQLEVLSVTLAEALRSKRGEQALRDSEERYRTITHTAQDAIITADAQGKIQFWNAAAEKIFGFAAAEVLGQNMMDCIVPPQYHKAKRKGLAEFARSGHGVAVGKTLELTALRKDGTEFPIEISVSGYCAAEGFVAVALVRDITNRKRAEKELREAHAETKELLEAIASVLISVNVDSRVTAWNTTAEAVFGIEAKDAVGRLLDEVPIRWDQASVARGMSECRATNRSIRLDELRFERVHGTEGFLGVTVNPMSDDTNGPDSLLLVAADITERKTLESQLTQAQKLESIGQLAAGIAHEINTPIQYVGDNTRFLRDNVHDLIRIVDRYAELLDTSKGRRSWDERIAEITTALKELDVEFLKEEIPKAIEQSLEGVERVAKIVRSMKEFSHPGGHDKQMADLNKAIESTITVSRNEWKYVAEMVTDLDPTLPLVPCFVGDFNQVILNMIINAAHAIADVVGRDSREKKTITVATRRDGDWAEIRISDTGSGIPEQIRSRVFDPFFTTKDAGKGTGQGLAIAHTTVVKKHGGELTFESEVGRGTTFIVRLPIGAQADADPGTECHEETYSLR